MYLKTLTGKYNTLTVNNELLIVFVCVPANCKLILAMTCVVFPWKSMQ